MAVTPIEGAGPANSRKPNRVSGEERNWFEKVEMVEMISPNCPSNTEEDCTTQKMSNGDGKGQLGELVGACEVGD